MFKIMIIIIDAIDLRYLSDCVVQCHVVASRGH